MPYLCDFVFTGRPDVSMFSAAERQRFGGTVCRRDKYPDAACCPEVATVKHKGWWLCEEHYDLVKTTDEIAFEDEDGMVTYPHEILHRDLRDRMR
jgi:hypothetical protein